MKIQYLFLLAFLASCSAKPAPVANAPQELPVIQISSGDATTYEDYPAAVEGTVNVEIRPQITGILNHIFVDDGAYVTKGQPIFKIDEAPFVEKLNNAKASLHTAEGALSNAQLEIEKLTPLVSGKVISDFQLKTAQSVREVALGNVEQAKADIATAKINLGYTLIKAPVSGFIGRLLRKEGSIVGPADPSPLTELSDVHNVHVFFALGEYDFIRFKSQYAGNTLAEKIQKLPPVDLILADDSAFTNKGKIDLINGQFDNNTGAITVRATFKNENGLLRSGNTGKIRLGLKLTNQMVVPQSATQEMQDKVFVFLVDNNNKVSKKVITISGKAGNNYLVKDGLKAGDRIVYKGYDHLHEGDVIAPQKADLSTSLVANN
ncbi:efflux RND transporter periplasmic adaptor subunit [Mucilaginibacter aquaedulcis]|uniref:efflux RND transporter periplasmic adaptor subunit n=1 Tax=Mucilaginibacter aquaedulcis TaxID=1187081 RepID=UPI0025B4A9F9|nr:efflux RND transporter periplasmic adaptor subunit [Mucilaginibacter aquaedulcis]MDN3548873.1 efflux RND transporter periplasmic adaptor subunit [Mucilaginibacter aquaedulcis]